MYKVLIVDDERIIRESISTIIDWEAYGFTLIGAAANGLEALKIIDDKRPELIVTDMKMPVISGNQLIEKVRNKYPDTAFAILSGHDDFEYVSESMKQGVKHYLLKPCEEHEVIEVLVSVSEALKSKEERAHFIRKNNEKLEKIIPLVKEQFIRDFIMSKHYSDEEMAYFTKLFNIVDKQVRVILLKPNCDYNFNTLFGLTNLLDKQMFRDNIYFKTIINKYVVLVVEQMAEPMLENALAELMHTFKHLTNVDLIMAYSNEGPLENVSGMFKKTQDYLDYAFYFDSACIISPKDIEEGLMISENDSLDSEDIITAVKTGNEESFNEKLEHYFKVIHEMKPDIDMVQFYCVELTSGMLRHSSQETSQKLLGRMFELTSLESFEQIKMAVMDIGHAILSENYSGIVHRQNKVVETMIMAVAERLNDETLSLKKLASEVMFMNAGYLSKLFSKEMGITFSGYLTKLRMEKSKELIKQWREFKVYEVAEAVGMGNNPQYFSQSFKKYTGMTPLEYRNSN